MGTRERRAREKADRRQAILGAARRLFLDRGYAATTMPRIAAAADLAPGTLYLYFPGKTALYAELLVEGYGLLEKALLEALDGNAAPRRQAEALIDAFLRFGRRYPEYFDIIFFVVQRETVGGLRATLPREQMRRLGEREDACKAIADKVMQRGGYGSASGVKGGVDAIWSMLAGVVLFFRKADAQMFANVTREAKRLILGTIFES